MLLVSVNTIRPAAHCAKHFHTMDSDVSRGRKTGWIMGPPAENAGIRIPWVRSGSSPECSPGNASRAGIQRLIVAELSLGATGRRDGTHSAPGGEVPTVPDWGVITLHVSVCPQVLGVHTHK